jgi:hypothetical protein
VNGIGLEVPLPCTFKSATVLSLVPGVQADFDNGRLDLSHPHPAARCCQMAFVPASLTDNDEY